MKKLPHNTHFSFYIIIFDDELEEVEWGNGGKDVHTFSWTKEQANQIIILYQQKVSEWERVFLTYNIQKKSAWNERNDDQRGFGCCCCCYCEVEYSVHILYIPNIIYIMNKTREE